MYELKKKLERYLLVNLLEPGPRLIKKEFTGPQYQKVEKHCSILSLTSAPDGGGWSTPCPDRFTPAKDPVPIV
jgi:hypothetical protein